MSVTKVALDFNVSPRIVGVMQELYGHRGFEFVHLRDLVAGVTQDEVWADVYRRSGGRVVISGDCRIAYRPHQAIAFIDSELISFFPSAAWSKLKGHAKAALLIFYWPAIERTIECSARGGCWRILADVSDGVLKLGETGVERLEIPGHVLDGARRISSGASDEPV